MPQLAEKGLVSVVFLPYDWSEIADPLTRAGYKEVEKRRMASYI
jgi:hypothetical protein